MITIRLVDGISYALMALGIGLLFPNIATKSAKFGIFFCVVAFLTLAFATRLYKKDE